MIAPQDKIILSRRVIAPSGARYREKNYCENNEETRCATKPTIPAFLAYFFITQVGKEIDNSNFYKLLTICHYKKQKIQ